MSVSITKVLLLDNVDPSAKNILESNGIKATICKEKLSAEDLVETLRDHDGVVVRSATKITESIIESCKSLNIIGRAGTGVDNIDVKAATKNNIVVMNTPNGNTLSAAEHTCALICSLSRNIPAADAHVKAGKWDRKAFMGNELFGKTLAIVGLGRIGMEVAQRMQSFGMTTIGYDPIVGADEANKSNIEWMQLKEIWPLADYITVHTPLIPQTRGLINAASLELCKSGVKLINCARGGIIDEDDLLKALESGKCGGAGLDVFVTEPTTNMTLCNHPKVIACPHLGASTKEGQARCGKDIAQQFVDVSSGKSYFGVINAHAMLQDTQKWKDVSVALGRAMNAMLGSVKNNKLFLRTGKDLSKYGKTLSAAACLGLLRDSKVTLMNSVLLAADHGIEVKYESVDNIPGLCSLESVSELKFIKLCGMVIADKPVLLSINGSAFATPIIMEGSALLVKTSAPSKDMQSAISALAAKGINVSSLSLAQKDGGDKWIGMALSKGLSDSTESLLPGLEAVAVQF